MLLVFGAACVGVLVEAFVPRERRYVAQVGARASSAWSPRSSASVFVGQRPRRGSATEPPAALVGSEGTHRGRRPDHVPLGPGAGLRPRRRAALRRARARGRRVGVRRPGRRPAGHRGRARRRRPGPRPHRGLPAAAVRGRRDDAVPGRQRPAHDVRGARGALAAALPAVRPGPAPPAAQPGSRDEVLPARRLLLRLLPLRRRAGLRLRRLDGLRRRSTRPSPTTPATRRCC